MSILDNRWFMIGLHIFLLGFVIYLLEEMIDGFKGNVRGHF